MRKVFVFLATAVFAFCSCAKEDVTKPSVNVRAEEWHRVPASGGIIQVHDLTLEFPAGAFEKTGKVAISPVRKGSVKSADGRELSEFYQLVFPKEGVKKPFTISIRYNGDAAKCYFIEESPKRERYTGVMALHGCPLETTIQNGAATTVFPDVCESVTNGQPFCTVGLVDGSRSIIPTTKSSNIFYYTVDWCVHKDSLKFYDTYRQEILDLFQSTLSDICKVYPKLGIEVPSDPVPYIFTPLEGGKWGQHNSGQFKKKNGTIDLNVQLFLKLVKKGKPYDTALLGQLQQTIIHETFHWLHENMYDPRYASVICSVGFNEWSMLSEAVATWIEKNTGDKKISENCPKFADNMLVDFFCANGSTFETTGYGMGYFIDWLAKKTSEQSIVKILEYQRDNGGSFTCPSLRAAFDKFLADNKLEFFKPADTWDKFAWDILTRKTDSRVDNSMYGGEYYVIANTTSFQTKGAPVYNFGLMMQRTMMSENYKGILKSNPGLSMSYLQNEENLITWICNQKFEKKGYTVKGKPFAWSGSDALANERHFLVTERINQDTSPAVIRNRVTIEAVPWPKFVEIEYNGYDGYYSWSGDEIKVTLTNNGYYVEADCTGGAHLHFYIGWVNNRFTDVANLYFYVEYDQSQRFEVGRIKLDYKDVSSIEKKLKWTGKHQGKDLYLGCELL